MNDDVRRGMITVLPDATLNFKFTGFRKPIETYCRLLDGSQYIPSKELAC